MDELAAACPEEMLLRVGYFGRAGGAADAMRCLAEGLNCARRVGYRMPKGETEGTREP